MIKNMNPEYQPKKREKSDTKKETLIDFLRTLEGKEFIITLDFGQEAVRDEKGK